MKYAVLLFLLLLGWSELGQAWSLSLEDCIASALKTNPQLNAALATVEAGQQGAESARKDLFPQLNASGRLQQLADSQRLHIEAGAFEAMPREDIDVSLENESYYSLNLKVRQTLYSGGELNHRLQQAEHVRDRDQFLAARKKRELVRDVSLAFHQVLNARLFAGALQQSLHAKNARLKTFETLAQEGYAEHETLLEQRADIKALKLDILKNDNTVAMALLDLQHLTGIDLAGAELLGETAFFDLELTSQKLVALALREREDLKAMGSETMALAEGVAVRKSEYLPHLSLEGGYTRQAETALTSADEWKLAAALEWKLFSWGQRGNRVRQSEAQLRAADYRRGDLKHQVIRETEHLWRVFQEAGETIALRREQLKLAEYQLKVTQQRYDQQRVRLDELNGAEAAFFGSYQRYLMALNLQNSALASLEAAVSMSLSPWVKSCPAYHPQSVVKKINANAGRNSKASAVVKEQGDFVVIAGSYRLQQYALKRKNELGALLGSRPIEIVARGDLFVVSIRGFFSRAQAKQKMKALAVHDYFIRRVDGN